MSLQVDYDLDIDPNKICRICLCQSDKLQNIFTNLIVDGYIIALPKILKNCIDLEVNEEEILPKKICDICKLQMNNFYVFKQKCKKSEEVLQKAFKNELIVQSNTAENINVIKESELNLFETDEKYEDNTNIGEEIGNQIKNDYMEMNVLKEKRSENDKKTISSINDANDTGSDIIEMEDEEFLEDSRSSIYLSDTEDVEDSKDTIKNPIVCKICDKSFPFTSRLKNHMVIHTGQRYKCKFCLKTYSNPASINRHKKICHAKHADTQANDQEVVAENIDEKTKELENSFPETTNDDLSINSETCDTEDKEFLTVILNGDIGKYKCIVCNKLISNRYDYIQHCMGHNIEVISCKTCSKIVHSKEELKAHEANHEYMDQLTLSKQNFFCNTCNKRLKSKIQYEQHMRVHESMNLIINYLEFFPCNICKIIFLTETSLLHHNQMHVNEINNELFVDDGTCTDYQFLEEVKDREPIEGIAYKCGVCNISYPNAFELKCHIILHSEKLSCPFEGCGCEYVSYHRLNIHMMSKHVIGHIHKCIHCNDFQCSSYDELQVHSKTTCNARQFSCDHCNKKFLSKKALAHHIKNTLSKEYMCQFCGKSFAQQGELTIHNRMHTGERPFKCTLCGKAYKTASMRTAHMDAHIQGKTFSCTLCDKKLQTKTSFRNHMKRHTEEKKHKCDVCGQKFFTKYHVKIHNLKVHQSVKVGRKKIKKVD